MKKFIKFLSMSLISAMIFFSVFQPITLAAEGDGEGATKSDGGVANIITGIENKKNGSSVPGVDTIGGAIVNWIWGISIVVAVIVLMIIGLKFIIGSTEEKAKYKESLIPLVVGILLLCFATTIVKIIFSINS